jgi:small subunit ribosomal protein S20
MATSSKAKKKTVRIASGRKRVRQDVRINAANTSLRSHFRTVVKNVQKAVLGGDKAKAGETFKLAQSVIDSVADKGVFHKNKAARLKSRLSAKVKALSLAAWPACASSSSSAARSPNCADSAPIRLPACRRV